MRGKEQRYDTRDNVQSARKRGRHQLMRERERKDRRRNLLRKHEGALAEEEPNSLECGEEGPRR